MITGKDKIRLDELEKDFETLCKEHQAIVVILFKKVKPMIDEFESRHNHNGGDVEGGMFL